MQNTLSDLNNYLFEQLERLYDDELSDAEVVQCLDDNGRE